MPRRPVVAPPLILTVVLVLSFHPNPATAGLIGYWQFDGCTTTDASGNGRDLSPFGGPTCALGRFGDAWSLDGASQYLDRSADPAFVPGNRGWSVAAWERTGAVADFRVMVSWYRCGANPSCGLPDAAYYALGLFGGSPYWSVRDDSGIEASLNPTVSTVTDGQWHLLVGTLSAAHDSVKVYVDGALQGALQTSLGTLTAGGVSIPLEVGRWFRTGWGTPDYYFPGGVDEARIYDEELSAPEVAALYARNSTAAVPAGEPGGLSIEASSPNPARGGVLRVAFTLPGAEPARLDLLDVAGRRVATRAVGLGAGRHEVDLGASGPLSPGVYLIRLAQGSRTVTRHVSVLR